MLGSFQRKVRRWMLATFGAEITGDGQERHWRFLEEALELVQASGCTREEAQRLLDYVYTRPVGTISQEVGGVMVTLAAWANTRNINIATCATAELDRCWANIAKIRTKQQSKTLRNVGKGLSLP